ncbi:hypothetical protein AVEN_16871-1 [Araneus ventricosus]|uniref:Mos1 transposase HTH domain-containing protein n=1 Tax=Araneus ventricosus TaxID=182803 RepID=A0A4Y2X3M6_ARAVE|nr:hypothetical protein AVEN_16871-1 [Araneus ventricosus]
MFKTIDQPANCEIKAVIKFFNARNVLPREIYRQINVNYGENAMSEGMMRKWVRMFRGKMSTTRSGVDRSAVITEELVRCIDEKVRSNRRFTISDLSMNFQITFDLYYTKL